MKRSLVLLLCGFTLFCCTTIGESKMQTRIEKEYLNGTWYCKPINEYIGDYPQEKFSWGMGVVGNNFFVYFDLESGIFSQGDGIRFIDSITELERNVFEIGLNIPFDHKPTDEEIAARKAAGPNEVIVVHFMNKDKIWIELKKGFQLDKDFDPKRNIYYRYSGPGTAVESKE